jgi:hypothetical protein
MPGKKAKKDAPAKFPASADAGLRRVSGYTCRNNRPSASLRVALFNGKLSRGRASRIRRTVPLQAVHNGWNGKLNRGAAFRRVRRTVPIQAVHNE